MRHGRTDNHMIIRSYRSHDIKLNLRLVIVRSSFLTLTFRNNMTRFVSTTTTVAYGLNKT